MDIATVIGMFAGFVCVVGAIVSGGDAGAFIHVPSAMIVVGGMISATLMSRAFRSRL